MSPALKAEITQWNECPYLGSSCGDSIPTAVTKELPKSFSLEIAWFLQAFPVALRVCRLSKAPWPGAVHSLGKTLPVPPLLLSELFRAEFHFFCIWSK